MFLFWIADDLAEDVFTHAFVQTDFEHFAVFVIANIQNLINNFVLIFLYKLFKEFN